MSIITVAIIIGCLFLVTSVNVAQGAPTRRPKRPPTKRPTKRPTKAPTRTPTKAPIPPTTPKSPTLAPTKSPIPPVAAPTSTQVFIGGAGIAAISAGQEFHKAGIKFWMGEASDRVGGRIFGTSFGGNKQTGQGAIHIEYGANWIQDLSESGKVIWNMAQKLGIDGSMTNFDNFLVYDNNGYLNRTETDFAKGSNCGRAADAYTGLEQLNVYCLTLYEGDGYPSNAAKAFCQKVLGSNFRPSDTDDVTCAKGQQITTGFYPPNEQNPAVARVCEWYYHDFEAADIPSRLSTINTIPWELNGGRRRRHRDLRRRLQGSSDDYFVTDSRGFQYLVESIGASYLSTSTNTASSIVFRDPRLNLNTKVIQVKWDPKGTTNVQVTLCPTYKLVLANSPILYPCIDGQSYTTVTASYFFSTFSLGVLKASVAQELRGGGTLEQTRDVAPVFVPSLSSIPALAKAIPAIGFSLYQKIFFQFPFSFWPAGVELLLTAYASGAWVGDFAPAWLSLDLQSSSSDSRYFPGSKVLVLTVTSDRAVELSSMTDDAIVNQVLPVLNVMFGNSIKAMNGGRLLSATDVLDFDLYRWHSDPLYRGAYSSNFINAPVDLLGDRYGNLVFSGEVTCHEYNGYVHGAYLAGIRSARLLLSKQLGVKGLNLNSICDDA